MLKPCPFCGWAATVFYIELNHNSNDTGPACSWRVRCNGCRAESGPYNSKEEAIQNWEKRVTYRSPITVKDAAKVIHKSPAYVRAMIINGKIPASCAIRDGKLIRDVSEIGSGKGRINYFISPVGWEMLFQQELFGKNFEEE